MATTGGCVLKLAGPCARAVLSKSCFPAATVLGHNSVSVRWHKAPQDEFRTGVHKNTIFRIMHKLNDKTPNDYELSNNNEPQTTRSHQNEEIPVPPASFNHFNAELNPGEGPEHDWETVPGSEDVKHQWPVYNKRMYAPDGTYRPAFVTHMRANVKYSPEKMWYVAAFCRGKTIDEAFKQLEFMNVKGARIMTDVLKEAREMALTEHHFEYSSDMWVAEALTERSKIIHSIRRHKAGRGLGDIKYRYCNIFVRLEEGKPPKHYHEYSRDMSPAEQIEKFVHIHRNKRTIVD